MFNRIFKKLCLFLMLFSFSFFASGCDYIAFFTEDQLLEFQEHAEIDETVLEETVVVQGKTIHNHLVTPLPSKESGWKLVEEQSDADVVVYAKTADNEDFKNPNPDPATFTIMLKDPLSADETAAEFIDSLNGEHVKQTSYFYANISWILLSPDESDSAIIAKINDHTILLKYNKSVDFNDENMQKIIAGIQFR